MATVTREFLPLARRASPGATGLPHHATGNPPPAAPRTPPTLNGLREHLNSLAHLRVKLTLGAIIGLLPVTLVFIQGAYSALVTIVRRLGVGSDTFLHALIIIGVATFSLAIGWKIYAIAMSAHPRFENKCLLVSGVLAGSVLGLLMVVLEMGSHSLYWIIYLTPSITATTMLVVTQKRIALAARTPG